MRPLTDTCPKPLLEVGGKPLIVHHLERLEQQGFDDIVINHAHLGDQIEAYLGDGANWSVRIRYSPEHEALETAGGIRTALPLLGDAPFIVINGDVFCDIDYSAMRDRRGEMALNGDLAHLILVPNPPQHPDGDFSLSHRRLSNHGSPRLTFSGVGLYHPALFATVPARTRHPLAPLLRQAAANNRISGECHLGDWQDIGTPERLAELDRRLRQRPS